MDCFVLENKPTLPKLKMIAPSLISRDVEVDNHEKEVFCLDPGVGLEVMELPEKEPGTEGSVFGDGWSSDSERKASGPSEKKPLVDWKDERNYVVVGRSGEEPPEKGTDPEGLPHTENMEFEWESIETLEVLVASPL